MRKYVFLICFLFLLGCQSQENNINDDKIIKKITNYYHNKLSNVFPQIKIKFVKKIENKDFPYPAYIFEFINKNEISKEIIYVNGNYFFTDFVDINNLISYREKAKEYFLNSKDEIILKELKNDKEFIISLGKNIKGEIFIFSDPECIYCKKDLKKINNEFLKDYKINFIFISLRNNFNKIAFLYKNLQNLTNDDEKLKIINSVYFNKEKINYLNKENNLKYKDFFEKYLKLGIDYTPYKIILNKEENDE